MAYWILLPVLPLIPCTWQTACTCECEGMRMAEQERRVPWFGFLIYLFAAVLILYVSMGNRGPAPKPLVYSEFLTQVLGGKVDAVKVTNSQLVGVLKATGESGGELIQKETLDRAALDELIRTCEPV